MDITWEFTIFDLLFLVGVVIVFVSFVVSRHYFKIYHAPEQIDRRFIRERWKKIEKLVGYGKEMNYKLAIIEADKLLDHVLREMHF